jgi:ABC-type nickel/cobalt efflux system permease component RcnA
MKNYLIIGLKNAIRKSLMSCKLYSFGSILLLLSSERNDNYLNIELSFAIILLILILCTAIFMIFKYASKQKTENLTESKKLR